MTQMFPATMLLLPFFILLAKLKLINSYLGLIIIYSSTVLPFCIWQMKGYYDTIPAALEEAARMDGCSRFSAFIKVILPVSAPALVITALFSFMASWSEYVVAAIVLQDPGLYTLPLGLKSFQASLSTQWGLYAAGAVVVSIPVMILFISLSRFLVSGLTVGSVKG
jgi:arabinogalactan oligomer/maltooligosaccharide transport system permease protein